MILKNTFRHRKRAIFYEKNEDGSLKCTLCPKYCLLQNGEIGVCRVRGNRGGVMYSMNYGWIRALNMENIEKVPLVEYYGGMNVLSIGSHGCNMHCPICSQQQLVASVGTGRALYPEEVSEIASKLIPKDSIGIAYSCGEPLVDYEFVLDTCKYAKRYDMRNIISTNGYINPKPLKYLLPHIDAVNLDIKTMNMELYEKWGGSLETVLENAKIIKEAGVHLEISNVLVPGLNDTKDDVESLAMFISRELGQDVPLHLLEHIPNNNVNYIRTPESDLVWAADLSDKYLDNVYIGTP